jgi:hypothetical protein
MVYIELIKDRKGKNGKSDRVVYKTVCNDCGREAKAPATILMKLVCVCKRHTKTKASNMEKYGVESVIMLPEVKDKIKQTNLAKLGVENPFQSKEIQNRIKQKFVERYGVENPLQSDEIKQRMMKTNLERYGVVSTLQLPEVQEKIKQTNKARYGAENPFQSEECRQKMKKTNTERHGVENPMQNQDICNKMMLSRHESCKDNMFRSKGELEVEAFVQSLGLECKHHSSGAKEIDIFVESCSIGIEYNGVYWHSDFIKQNIGKRRHKEKKDYYLAQGISLIQIWDHHWEKRREQVCNYLTARLGKNQHRVGTRKCVIQEIDAKTARAFIEAYHIQGARTLHIELALAAFFEGEMVAVATFANHHRGLPVKVLNRLCSKRDWTVSGFLGKAVRTAAAHFNSDIVSWVDLMWSDGTSYEAAGFELQDVLAPDYFYYNKLDCTVVSKQSFRKIDDRTESQRAIDAGMAKVYDAGKARYLFKNKETQHGKAQMGGR